MTFFEKSKKVENLSGRQAKQLETGKKRASRKKKDDNSADKPTKG